MAQATKKATKQRPRHNAAGTPVTREYVRGVRDTLRAMFAHGLGDTWQRDDVRRAAAALGVPSLYVALLEAEHVDPPYVTVGELDAFTTWLDLNEIERDFALGEEA